MPEDGAALIAGFARRQIRTALTDTTSGEMVTVSILGRAIAIRGPQGPLAGWITANLTTLPADTAPDYRILCRSGPAFLEDHPDFALFEHLSDLDLEAALARVGLTGRLCRTPLVWDLFDPAARLGLRLQLAPDALPEWEATAPIANFLAAIARAEAHGMIHAASLSRRGQGCLIVGEGGRGKSGTTLGCVLHGLDTAGDDYVLVTSAPPYVARPVYRTMKQDAGGLMRCGLDPADFGARNWQGKHVFAIDALRAGALSDGFALGAVLVPRITGGAETRIAPVSGAEAFAAVMPSSLGQLSGDRRARFAETGALIRALPCRSVALGTDPREVTAVISDWLERGCP
ncbi:MAG: hypothetical protein JJT81_14480 [Rubellimicrobium sp.]|nr:hypothetical protein [Rubellimicrobium sp.]